MTATSRLAALVSLAVAALAVGCSGPTDGPARGEALYAKCVSCHMADGAGKTSIAAPSIAGLPEWYVINQLDGFKKGYRGTHPDDAPGMRMRPMALGLIKEDELKLVAAHVAKMPRPAVTATLKGDATKGKAAYMVCAACHKPDGKGDKTQNAPPLVGMNDWYLATQLKNFKSGIRGANPKDLTGAQMAPMAATLADEAAIHDVVAYIMTLGK